MLGCGPGVLGPDIQLFGLDPVELRPMLNESTDIILKLFREDGLISYEGKYWQIKDMELQIKPYQQPHLPIYLVSSGSGNSTRVAAERELPVISGVHTLPGAMDVSQQWPAYEQIAKDAGHSVGRDDWRMGNALIYLADSMEEAKRDIAEGALYEIQNYPFKGGLKSAYEAYPDQPAEEITLGPDHRAAKVDRRGPRLLREPHQGAPGAHRRVRRAADAHHRVGHPGEVAQVP